MIRLTARCNRFSWENGFYLPWRCETQSGCGIRWKEKTPAWVSLDARKAYLLHYSIGFRASGHEAAAGSIVVKTVPRNAFFGILPLHFSVEGQECDPLTLHDTTILLPQSCAETYVDVSLLLNSNSTLSVEQAVLNIIEL